MANVSLTGTEQTYVNTVQTNGQLSAYQVPVSITNLTNFEGSTYLATSLTITSSTSLSATPLVVNNLVAGGVYVFDLYLSTSTPSAAGLKLSFGGSATATSLSADTWAYNTTTVAAQQNITSLASTLLAYTGSVTTVNITGTIICSGSGTFNLSAAQNAASGNTFVNVGSNFWIDRIA